MSARGLARGALLLAILLSACGDGGPPERLGDAPDSVLPPAPDPEVEALRRWRARLPAGLLVRSGVCPFECCTYGEWLAQSEIPLVAEPRSPGAAPLSRIPPGTRFRADSGRVYVTGLALVAVDDTVTASPGVTLRRGDTLAVLDYVGEGYHHVWRDGEVLEVQGFWRGERQAPRGEMIGEHATEWWVHATLAGGRGGWFHADAPGVDFHGADGCGSPEPV